MRSLRNMAARLLIGLSLACCAASPPGAAVAGPQAVFNKLERFLTGRGAKARPQNRKARPGKSRRQAAPGGKGRTAAKRRPEAPSPGAGAGEKKPPLPSPKTQPEAPPQPSASALPAVVPIPPPKPGSESAAGADGAPPAVSAPPLPEPAPRKPAETPTQEEAAPAKPAVAGGNPVAPPAADEKACRSRLAALGVRFEDRPAESDPGAGCSLPHPVFVTRFSAAVSLEPGGLMNCAIAEATARFIRDVVQPAARKEMGSDLTGIGQASAYVCRTRHGRSKMSEHAFGNALDISRFTFADKATADVGPVPGEKQARFLDAVRKAACGPFKTVLGPGSDPDHATHFHLDLEQRRHGGTFCQ